MKHIPRSIVWAALAAMIGLSFSSCTSTGPVTRANAANISADQLTAQSKQALRILLAKNNKAYELSHTAKGILVFPRIMKGGFMLGAMGGNGALIHPDGSVSEFYETAGLSYGLQAGLQKASYAVFLMDDAAFDLLHRRGGWEIGSSPSLVVIDRGVGANLSTTTMDKGTYAFFFDQAGLMAGLSLQGAKITRIYPSR